jgi:hypothetical protein
MSFVLHSFTDTKVLAVTFQIETPDVSSEDKETRLFPDKHLHEMNITAHALTTDFLIYASDVSDFSLATHLQNHKNLTVIV